MLFGSDENPPAPTACPLNVIRSHVLTFPQQTFATGNKALTYVPIQPPQHAEAPARFTLNCQVQRNQREENHSRCLPAISKGWRLTPTNLSFHVNRKDKNPFSLFILNQEALSSPNDTLPTQRMCLSSFIYFTHERGQHPKAWSLSDTTTVDNHKSTD